MSTSGIQIRLNRFNELWAALPAGPLHKGPRGLLGSPHSNWEEGQQTSLDQGQSLSQRETDAVLSEVPGSVTHICLYFVPQERWAVVEKLGTASFKGQPDNRR